MNQEQKGPFIVHEEPIPFGDRLLHALQQFFWLLALAPTCLLAAPITFFKILFTSKKKVLMLPGPKQLGTNPSNPFGQANDEPWKKQHDELFGEDE